MLGDHVTADKAHSASLGARIGPRPPVVICLQFGQRGL